MTLFRSGLCVIGLTLAISFIAQTTYGAAAEPSDFEAAEDLFYTKSAPVTTADLVGISGFSGNCVRYEEWIAGGGNPGIFQYYLESAALVPSDFAQDPVTGNRVNIEVYQAPNPDEFAGLSPTQFSTMATGSTNYSPVRVQIDPTYGEDNQALRDLGFENQGPDQEYRWFYLRKETAGNYWTALIRDEFLQPQNDRSNTSFCYVLPTPSR